MGITEIALPDGMTPEMLDVMDTLAGQVGALSFKLQIQQPGVADPANPGAFDMLGVYTPGTTFETYGEGNGKLLKGGKNVYLDFNIHYTTTGREGDRPVPTRTLVPTDAPGACALPDSDCCGRRSSRMAANCSLTIPAPGRRAPPTRSPRYRRMNGVMS